ncbi:MAG: putative Dephospho-CoA kinaselike protein [Candidatus Saccharibacteria bacterium]|nr:putative Dephospho-CoA kinaselike protein [Candidatus Saccharibacteria bacterium]
MVTMQQNKAIIFVGMPGAGKSVCVEHLKSKGLPSAYFGGITIDEVKARGMEVNEANERLVREDIRVKEGKGAYAVRIITQIEEHFEKGHNHVVVDGLYSWTEYKIFKESLEENAVIIAVIAPRATRHKRLSTRPVRPLTDQEATERDYAEIEKLEKGGPIANADYYLSNNDNPEQLLKSLDELLVRVSIEL